MDIFSVTITTGFCHWKKSWNIYAREAGVNPLLDIFLLFYRPDLLWSDVPEQLLALLCGRAGGEPAGVQSVPPGGAGPAGEPGHSGLHHEGLPTGQIQD